MAEAGQAAGAPEPSGAVVVVVPPPSSSTPGDPGEATGPPPAPEAGPSEADALRDKYFERFARLLDREASTFQEVVQFKISDVVYTVDGRSDATRTTLTKTAETDWPVACVVATKFEDLRAVLTGAVSMPVAVLKRQIVVSGNREALFQIAPLLRRCVREEEETRRKQRRSARRARNAAALGSSQGQQQQAGQPSAEQESFQFVAERDWVADDERQNCVGCSAPFQLFRRRHHCRGCGDVFCKACTQFRYQNQRVCAACAEEIRAFQLREVAARDAAEIAAAASAGDDALADSDGDGDCSSEDEAGDPRDEEPDGLLLGPLLRQMHEAKTESIPASIRTARSAPDHDLAAAGPPPLASVSLQSDEHGGPRASRWALPLVLSTALGIVSGIASYRLSLVPGTAANAWEQAMSALPGSTLALSPWLPGTLVAASTLGSGWLWWCYSTGLIVRRCRVFWTAILVFGRYQFLKRVRSRFWPLDDETDELRWDAEHHLAAQRVLKTTLRLRGFWIKLGQYLSSRSDVMPEPWIKHLSVLQDEIPASPMEDVEQQILEGFGKPLFELFSAFDPVPLGAASIAQVHLARLRSTGEEVVVKVKHRNIDRIMRQDLENLDKIMSWIAFFEPDFDYRPVFMEWAKVALRELDFRNEVKNLQTVGDNLRAAKIDVIVPRCDMGLVSPCCFVMEFCRGFKVTDTTQLDLHGIDRLALLNRICQAYAQQVYVDGLFNADPHAGNILVSVANGHVQPVLLDFGMCRALTNPSRIGFAKLAMAAKRMDCGGLLESFEEIGLKMKRDSPLEDMKSIRFILRDSAPKKESRDASLKYRKELMERRKLRPKGRRNPVEAWPPDLMFFLRVTMLLKGLCTQLEVRVPYLSLLSPYARYALLNRTAREGHATLPVPRAQLQPDEQRSLQSRVLRLMRRLFAEGALLGGQVAVYHKGALVVDACAGVLGDASPERVQPDTLFNCFSVSKAVAVTPILQAVDQELISLDTPLAAAWKEFGCQGKEACTVRQMLNHQAGLQMEPALATLQELCTWDTMLAKMASAKPLTQPGAQTKYHTLSFGWLCGGLARALHGGAHLGDLVQAHIAAPLQVQEEFLLGGVTRSGNNISVLLNNLFGSADENALSPEELGELLQELRAQREQDAALTAPVTAAPTEDVRAASPSATVPATVAAPAPVPSTPRTNLECVDELKGMFEPDHPHAELMRSKFQELIENYAAGSDRGWTVVEERSGVTIAKQDGEGLTVRGTCRINRPAKLLLEIVSDRKEELNPDLKLATVLHQYDDSSGVEHQEFNGIFPVSGRDFVLLLARGGLSNGTKLAVATSVEWAEKPPLKRLVRAECHVGGYVIVPVAGDPGACDMTYVTSVDLKGKIPGFIQRQVALSQPMIVNRAAELALSFADWESYLPEKEGEPQPEPQPEASPPAAEAGEAGKDSEAPEINAPPASSSSSSSSAELSSDARAEAEAASTTQPETPEAPPYGVQDDQPHAELLRTIFARLAVDFKGAEADGWQFELEKQDVRIYKKVGAELTTVRGQGVVGRPVELVVEVIRNQKLEYDGMAKEIRVVEQLTEDSRVQYEDFKGIFPVSGRDFVLVNALSRQPDGSVLLAATSVAHKDAPERRGRVRGQLDIGGFCIRPIEGNPAACEVTYVASVDLMGSIPAFIKAKVAVDQPMCVAGIRKVAMAVTDYEAFLRPTAAAEEPGRAGSGALGAAGTKPPLVLVNGEPQGAPARPPSTSASASPRAKPAEPQTRPPPTMGVAPQAGNAVDAAADSMKRIDTSTSATQLLLDPGMYNLSKIKAACIPSANGHFSARALAKFYAVLANQGQERFGATLLSEAMIHELMQFDAAKDQAGQKWQLGFRKYGFRLPDGTLRSTGFGHSGVGGSIALCDPTEDFAVAITLNKLTLEREATRRILHLVCSHLGLGLLTSIE